MGLSAEVRELLQQGREQALAELVEANPAALRPLMGRLWDPDATVRRLAARAIGGAAVAHPDRALEIVRRLMWGLNDESTTNGVYGIPALGEIGRHAPEMLAPFVPALASMMEDPGLRLELLSALAAIAESDPARVVPHLRRASRLVDEFTPEQRRAFARLVASTEESSDAD